MKNIEDQKVICTALFSSLFGGGQSFGCDTAIAIAQLVLISFRLTNVHRLAPIRENNRGISGFEQVSTPVAGILTPIRKNIRDIYCVDHDMTAVTNILILGLQLY